MRKWLENVVTDMKDNNRSQFTLKDGDKLVAQVRQAEHSATELERRFAERLGALELKLSAFEATHRGSQEVAALQMEVAQLRSELARARPLHSRCNTRRTNALPAARRSFCRRSIRGGNRRLGWHALSLRRAWTYVSSTTPFADSGRATRTLISRCLDCGVDRSVTIPIAVAVAPIAVAIAAACRFVRADCRATPCRPLRRCAFCSASAVTFPLTR